MSEKQTAILLDSYGWSTTAADPETGVEWWAWPRLLKSGRIDGRCWKMVHRLQDAGRLGKLEKDNHGGFCCRITG